MNTDAVTALEHQTFPDRNDREGCVAPPEGTEADGPALIAYRVDGGRPLPPVPAPRGRAWMEATGEGFANRCLPLLIANQAGWLLLNPVPLRATWTGGADPASLTVEETSPVEGVPRDEACAAVSHFGHGVLTFWVPYLFRTPPGYNLIVRGPANWPKDGACPLEGIVETDWSEATFTMNWKLTRPGLPVIFAAGEPFAMIVPQRRGELEAFRPAIRAIETDPETHCGFQEWVRSRSQFLIDLKQPGSTAVRERWQKHYYQGSSPAGRRAPAHQTRLKLREFAPPPRES